MFSRFCRDEKVLVILNTKLLQAKQHTLHQFLQTNNEFKINPKYIKIFHSYLEEKIKHFLILI